MSHHEEEGSRHGYDAELVAEELRKPTREQIAATIHSVACPDCWIGSKYDLDIADALLREYEIRERETEIGKELAARVKATDKLLAETHRNLRTE